MGKHSQQGDSTLRLTIAETSNDTADNELGQTVAGSLNDGTNGHDAGACKKQIPGQSGNGEQRYMVRCRTNKDGLSTTQHITELHDCVHF